VRVAEAVGAALAELGGRHAFGLVGSGNFAATNALADGGVRFVPTRHEGAAVTMTDVYSRLTGEVGVCTVHQGPGLTNAMTGLAEAAKSRTPLVLLAAEAAAAAVNSNFRIDQDGLVTSVGALAERVHGPGTVSADVGRAVWRARVERRPVVLMLPLDVGAANCEPPAVSAPPRLAPVRPAASAVREAAGALAGARRPLLLAGRGAVLAGARVPLERLGDRLGALLATSAVANGLFAESPWALGISGGFASPFAAELIASSDAVLGVGATLNMWTTRHGRLLGPDAIVVQVDAEAAALGAHHRVDVGVVGDAAETAAALLEELDRREHRGQGWRTPELRERLGRTGWRDEPYADAGTGDRIDPRTLSIALDATLPAERTVAVDSGHFMGWPSRYLRVPDPQGFVFTQGFQAVGLGLAGAIAAALARPDRLAVAALGDGGALMAASELETVARLGLRMLVVVYNDAAYGAEVHHFGPQGARLDTVRFPEADLAALARGAGLAAATVRRTGDLAALDAWLRAPGDRALLLDAKVVPDVVAEWLEEAFRGH
jgi:thiamine pyrophosphate-dependent acetolactate synthase large subunit-like protein